uniref:FERM domain containing 4A n=1 Tax=Rousettus aegyptiacus TaxID=9407 RepID=A0A7J8E7C8_ROUAE|nr:FERM domain containing 4A [Rousettus aegyptiacus]
MTEGRRCQVHLLDDRKLELLVQPKLLAKELLDLVASHFNLKEKEYFGIAFTDETGHLNWLQLDRRVLEHDFPKKSGPVVLYFCVRFYIESISYLKDNATIELFFLNAKSCIYKELIDVDSEVVFELASYILQEAKGDFSR